MTAQQTANLSLHVVFFVPDGTTDPKQITTSYSPVMLRQLFTFPEDRKGYPVVAELFAEFAKGSGKLRLCQDDGLSADDTVIMLGWQKGQLVGVAFKGEPIAFDTRMDEVAKFASGEAETLSLHIQSEPVMSFSNTEESLVAHLHLRGEDEAS